MKRREFASLVLLGLAPVARAQVQVLPPPPRVIPPGASPAPAPTPAPTGAVIGRSTVAFSGGRGTVNTAADKPIPERAALQHFAFRFQNGDHKFRLLLLRPEGHQAAVAFNDQNEDDPFEMRATWVHLPAGQAGAIGGAGHGRAVSRIPLNVPPNHVFALRGFEFRRADGTDANVRHIAIRRVGNFVEVLLSDDEGMDLRTPQGAFNVLDPLHSHLAKSLSGSGQSGRPYRFNVQYVWIPRDLVAGEGVITGSERRRIDAARVPAAPSVIRGFSFSFLNSDHHLLHIEASTLGGGMGIFRDNDEDDPVRWSIEYATLRA